MDGFVFYGVVMVGWVDGFVESWVDGDCDVIVIGYYDRRVVWCGWMFGGSR